MSIRIYVENKARRDPAYAITPEIWRRAVGSISGIEEPEFFEDTSPNISSLERAHVFVGSGFDPQRLQAHGKSLKLVHCTSAGVDKYLPLDWLPPETMMTNSGGIHAAKAEEYAMMALLALSMGIPAAFEAQRKSQWKPEFTTTAAGRHVLIVGLGKVGSAVAKAARTLGMRVSAVSRHGSPSSLADDVRTFHALPELLPTVDFLVLCCPLTAETRSMINEPAIALLPRGAGLINIARGPVVDTPALITALQSKHLSGAIVDVFDQEPLPESSSLWNVPNLLITPHVSCDVPKGYIDMALSKLGPNLKALARGERPVVNVVSRELGY